MVKIDDGGPAFPVMHSIDGNWQKEPIEKFMGLSLRDWFAGQAMVGVIVGSAVVQEETGTASDYPSRVAEGAYEIADAMLSTRKNMEKGE